MLKHVMDLPKSFLDLLMTARRCHGVVYFHPYQVLSLNRKQALKLRGLINTLWYMGAGYILLRFKPRFQNDKVYSYNPLKSRQDLRFLDKNRKYMYICGFHLINNGEMQSMPCRMADYLTECDSKVYYFEKQDA